MSVARRKQISLDDMLEAARQEGYEAGYRAALRSQATVTPRGSVVDLAQRRQDRTIDLARIRDIAEEL